MRFIATLSEKDRPDWSGEFLEAAKSSATASPSGRYLGFMSQRSLTGYDNRDAQSGEPLQEVYRYDALADELICASCNPSGARPLGLEGSGKELSPEFDPQTYGAGRHWPPPCPRRPLRSCVASPSTAPAPSTTTAASSSTPRTLSSLPTPTASGDVYQYEPSGTGDCSASSGGAATSISAGGCVSLISSGTGEDTSAFLDASEGGDDVFFYTTAQLSVTDEDHAKDIYDARVNGEPATLPINPECLGEACQPAAQAPNDATPASAAFRGEGNVKASAPRKRCASGKRAVKRKGKARCVPRKQSKRQRKANRNRRAGR